MSQEQSTEAQRAEERTQDTRAFVRRVRTLTRRKYTPEEKIRIVLEGFRREVTVCEILACGNLFSRAAIRFAMCKLGSPISAAAIR